MVPKGWTKYRLGDLSSTVTSGSRDWAQYYADSGALFIRMTNLRRGGISLKLDDLKYVNVNSDSSDGKRTQLEQGDILISITAELGKIGLVPPNLGEAYINQHTALVRLKKSGCCSTFLAYLLSSRRQNKLINRLNDAGAKAGLNLPTIKSIPVVVPPLPEQQKIAQILFTWDKAIDKLEALIRAKQQRKKALMQQLFPAEGEITPKLRFPEFQDAGEWKKSLLEKVATFSKGKGISKSDISQNGALPCIRYGELYTHYNEIIDTVISFTDVSPDVLTLSKANDVIIPASGETQEDIATAACVLKSGIALGGDLNIIRTKMNGVFLSYYLNNAKKKAIAQMSQGISVVHLYSSQLKNLSISQQKIATVLTAVDTEIETHRKQLNALNQKRKGLMQQLLTGKKRVKLDAEPLAATGT